MLCQENAMKTITLVLFTSLLICLVSGCQESKDQIPDGSFRLTTETLVDTKDIIVKHVIIEAPGTRSVKVTEDGSLSSVSNVKPLRDTDTMNVKITFVASLIKRSDSAHTIKWLVQLKSRVATAGGPSTFPVEADSLDNILQLDLSDGVFPLGHDLVVGRFQGKPIVLLVE
jgi:hypothetical protein